jgi:hypothetical protein
MCLSHVIWCSLCASILIVYVSIIEISKPILMALKKELVGRQPNCSFPIIWVCTQLCYCYDCVFMFKLVFVPSKAFRMMRDNSCFDSVKKQKLLCSVQKNLKITGTCFCFDFFTHDWYTNCPRYPNFSDFLEIQKYGHYSDCYRLFCFR